MIPSAVLASLALLPASPVSAAPAAHLVVTTTKHNDAASMMGQQIPARDVTVVTWIGTDRMRQEEGGNVTIVRADRKKLYLVDTEAKTYSALDMPVDVMAYVPEEMAPMMESMFSGMKATVTPTEETRKIGDWNTTKYTMTMTMPMGSASKTIWATKDVEVDLAAYHDLQAAMLSMIPGAASMAEEWKKVEGVPVLVESTQAMMGSEIKSKETTSSIERKEPAEGLYEVPEGFTEKPFDFMAEMQKKSPAGKDAR